MPDVQDPAPAVDDDSAARDMGGERRTAGRIGGAVQERQQPGEGFPLVRMARQVRLGGGADVVAGERHVVSSGRRKGYGRVGAAHVGASCLSSSGSDVIW